MVSVIMFLRTCFLLSLNKIHWIWRVLTRGWTVVFLVFLVSSAASRLFQVTNWSNSSSLWSALRCLQAVSSSSFSWCHRSADSSLVCLCAEASESTNRSRSWLLFKSIQAFWSQYGWNKLILNHSVRLHAQLSQITAIVRLCYSTRQLQLSEYTCRWENRIIGPEHVIPRYARWRCAHFN